MTKEKCYILDLSKLYQCCTTEIKNGLLDTCIRPLISDVPVGRIWTLGGLFLAPGPHVCHQCSK